MQRVSPLMKQDQLMEQDSRERCESPPQERSRQYKTWKGYHKKSSWHTPERTQMKSKEGGADSAQTLRSKRK